VEILTFAMTKESLFGRNDLIVELQLQLVLYVQDMAKIVIFYVLKCMTAIYFALNTYEVFCVTLLVIYQCENFIHCIIMRKKALVL